jgi:hypothetical protein
MHTKFWTENLQGRDHLEDLEPEGRVILAWILGIKGAKAWTGRIWLRVGPMVSFCEHGKEPPGSIKGKTK